VVVASVKWKPWRWLHASVQPATVLGLTMIAASWLGIIYILSIERSKSVEGAIQQGGNLARLLEENTVSTLNGIDRTLLYEDDKDFKAPAASVIESAPGNQRDLKQQMMPQCWVGWKGRDGALRRPRIYGQRLMAVRGRRSAASLPG